MNFMVTYGTLVQTLIGIFPEISEQKDYIIENESLPYAFAADLMDYLRKEFEDGKIEIDNPKIERLFSILSELGHLPSEENKDIVPSGFFESMLYGEPSDKYFIEAARKYLGKDMYRLFRVVQTHYIGDPKDFVDPLS